MTRSSCGVLIAALSLPATAGCGDAYCQSGPKYGTQCYSAGEIPSRSDPAAQRPADGALFRQGPPSPQGTVYAAPPQKRAPPPPSPDPAAAPPGAVTPLPPAVTPPPPKL